MGLSLLAHAQHATATCIGGPADGASVQIDTQTLAFSVNTMDGTVWYDVTQRDDGSYIATLDAA
jgi:hypothetical protein